MGTAVSKHLTAAQIDQVDQSNRLLKLINDIGLALTHHAVAEYATRQVGEQARFGTAFGPRLPMSLAVLDLNTPASSESVLPTLQSWARMVSEERAMADDDLERAATVAGCCAYLRSATPWIVVQAWVDEYEAELTAARKRLARMPHTPLYEATQDVGRCIELIHDVEPPRSCIGHVQVDTDATKAMRARCDRCGRRYDAVSLVRLQMTHERELG